MAEVYQTADGKNHARNARIHIATYQTLDSDHGKEARNFFFKHYLEKNQFSHIVIDECHRSAWGDWKFILENNPDAVQIGLTATPRQLIIGEKASAASQDEAKWRDNVKHFGEAVYEYTLSQGIEDGYLAPPEIFTFDLFHEQLTEAERARRVTRGELANKKLRSAATGAAITAANLKEQYSPSELDERLLLPERVLALSKHLLEQLIAHGGTPEQKTVLFCASDRHAEAVSEQLGNLYQDWCLAHGLDAKAYFAFKCTAKSGGADHVPDLRGSASSHFIACTVELLSTGVDVPCLQNIAFMQYISSPIVFAQMLGRGTRLDPDSGKLMFRVFDYTEATSLLGRDFLTKFKGGKARPRPTPPPAEPPVIVEGVQIRIEATGRYLTATVEGRHARVTLEQYRERVAERLVAQASAQEWLSSRGATSKSTTIVEPGSILVVIRSGILKHTLPVGLVTGRIAFNQDIKAIIPDSRILASDYLAFWLKSQEPRILAYGVKVGPTVHSVESGCLEDLQIAIPKLDSQRRIASRLKEQMAAVEQARQRVEAQSKAAGLLWERILAEAIDVHRDETWTECCLGDLLSSSLRTGISKHGTPTAKHRCLGLSSVRNGRLDLSASKPIDLTAAGAERNRIMAGTFYVVRGNGNVRLVGRGAIAPDEVGDELVFPDLLIEVNQNPELLDTNYLRWAWDAPSVRQEIELRSMTSSGIYKINLGNLAQVPLPIPPLSTQRHIAARLREQFEHLQHLKFVLTSQLAALDRLPGAYLREAFGGLQ